RVGAARQGYRHGTRARQLTTSLGPATFALPRGRLTQADGATTEWRSHVIPRYQRRTRRVDEAVLGLYLAGATSRRIRGALRPLIAGGPLSKDVVSRVVARLTEAFAAWRARDLAADQIRYLFCDGWFPIVRVGTRRTRVPVLVTLGVTASGARHVLDLRVAGAESAAAWGEVVDRLIRRHIGAPVLAVIDGHAALPEALRAAWPQIRIQRCTVHKLRNLVAKAPRRLHEERTEDYRRMIYAPTGDAVHVQRTAFRAKWRRLCRGVVESLDEAGDDLFTFLSFPHVAVESAADDERARADQRGVPAADEDAGHAPERRRRARPAVRAAAQRGDHTAAAGGLARPHPGHGDPTAPHTAPSTTPGRLIEGPPRMTLRPFSIT
ncbi:MAG: IS256 family transposase, partial [Gemmatimonadota bacterium]|nr:IS256 family transposase [Gemmatimonadota bacterium]